MTDSVAGTVLPASGVSPDIVAVAAATHTCALSRAGLAYCWGYNADGQLGNNDTSIVNPTPVAVANGIAFQTLSISRVENVTISSGTGYSCGVVVGDSVYCWGDNSNGALGDGTILPHAIPEPVRWP